MKKLVQSLKSYIYMYMDPAMVLLIVLPAIVMAMNIYLSPRIATSQYMATSSCCGLEVASIGLNITHKLLLGYPFVSDLVEDVSTVMENIVRGSWTSLSIACSIVGSYVATFSREIGYEHLYLARPVSRRRIVFMKISILMLSAIALGATSIAMVYGIVDDDELYIAIARRIAIPTLVKMFMLGMSLTLIAFTIAYISKRMVIGILFGIILTDILVPFTYNIYVKKLVAAICPSGVVGSGYEWCLYVSAFIDVGRLVPDFTVFLFTLVTIATFLVLYLCREVL